MITRHFNEELMVCMDVCHKIACVKPILGMMCVWWFGRACCVLRVVFVYRTECLNMKEELVSKRCKYYVVVY